MPKMHYFSNKFSKIAKRWGLSATAPLIFGFGDLKLRDVAKLYFFQADYDKIELHKISYDVILVTLSLLRHRKTSPK